MWDAADVMRMGRTCSSSMPDHQPRRHGTGSSATTPKYRVHAVNFPATPTDPHRRPSCPLRRA